MSDLTFQKLEESDIGLLHAWFEDKELSRRIEAPTLQWLNYVESTNTSYAWLIYEDSNAVAVLSMEEYPDHTASFMLYVNPKLRQQGYCKRILRVFLQRPEVKNLKQIEGTIETDNVGSMRCAQQVGFVQVSAEPDEEGFLHFTYNPLQSDES